MACPLTLFVVFWWSSAALNLFGLAALSEGTIAFLALGGLTAGIVLDALFLKRWTRRFYGAKLKWLVALYMLWPLIALSLFMGVPKGLCAIGFAAGFYVARRLHHEGAKLDRMRRAERQVSLLVAAVVGGAMFPIGLLALEEQPVRHVLERVIGSDSLPALILVCSGCLVLAAIQYFLTRMTARLAHRIG